MNKDPHPLDHHDADRGARWLVMNARNIMTPPTHIIPAQAGRILADANGNPMAPSTLNDLMRKGKPLQSEDWYGTRMIPVHRLIAFMDSHPGRFRGLQVSEP
jgi:hypothetical protein